MDKSYESHIKIYVESENKLNTIYRSLIPEAREPPNPSRVSVSIDKRDEYILIRIVSRDLSSLRAGLNTFLYLLSAVLRIL
ncbi:MAG: KEOPS complex subunit Pcc1 [Sulfolobales archaeon]